jgi:hypothetical protein
MHNQCPNHGLPMVCIGVGLSWNWRKSQAEESSHTKTDFLHQFYFLLLCTLSFLFKKGWSSFHF